MADKKKPTRPAKRASSPFTAEERAAMREHAKEMKAARSRKTGESEEPAVVAKIAEMPEPDRAMAARLHELITAAAPELAPRLWYGMPAYSKDGNVLCFFQGAHKFKARYSTLGFSDKARLDDGQMWPVAFALPTLRAEDEARIATLVKRAVGR